jgi:hypothetical protein
MMKGVPGRIQSIVNIHNPSIEVHVVDPAINTGTVVILAPGGGHDTLNVGTEGADFVSFFYQYGVNTVILRNRLRSSGYNPQTDAVYDAQQAVRLVRSRAKEWNVDPKKIGIVGFSTSLMRRTRLPAIRWQVSVRVLTLSDWSIRARHPFNATRTKRYRQTRRRRLLRPPAPVTSSTRTGRTSIFRRFCGRGFRTWKCTSTVMVFTQTA